MISGVVGLVALVGSLFAFPAPAQAQRSTPCGPAPDGFNVIVSKKANIVGTNGNDFICGDKRANRIQGRGGTDIISGRGGNDVIYGGRGTDLIRGGNGNDRLFGGHSADVIIGGAGRDRIDGGAGKDVLSGAQGADLITGGRGHDSIFGGPGNDTLKGGTGNDMLVGEAGKDRIAPGAGADIAPGRGGKRFSTGNPALTKKIRSVAISYEYRWTTAGGVYSPKAYLVFPDGTQTTDFAGVINSGVGASKKAKPKSWNRWRISGGDWQRQNTNGSWETGAVTNEARRTSSAKKLNGCWKASSVGAFLGDITSVSTSTFCFSNNGTFSNDSSTKLSGTVIGGSKSNSAGFYEIRGNVLSLVYANGKTKVLIVGYGFKEKELVIGGSTYLFDD